MPDQKQSILLGALVTALLSALLAFFTQSTGQGVAMALGVVACCLPAFAGAFLSVWNFTDRYQVTLGTGEGARLGAWTGAFGGLLSTVLTFLLRVVGIFPSAEEQVQIARERMMDQGMSEQQMDQALRMTESMTSPTAQVLFSIAFIFVAALLGAGAGAVGSAVFKKGGPEPSIPPLH